MKDYLKEAAIRLTTTVFKYFKNESLYKTGGSLPIVTIGVEATFLIIGVFIFMSFVFGSLIAIVLAEG